MDQVRRFLSYVFALDPMLTTDQKLARWADIAALAGVPVTLITGAIGTWLFSHPWIGVVVGLGIWNLALSGLVALRRLQSSTLLGSSAESKPENAAARPTPSDIDSRQAQDNEPTAAYADMAIAQLAEDEFEGFKRNVFALGLAALSERGFQIERASMDKGKLVIVVEDVKGRLHLGDKLRVVDAEDFYPMGTFEVVRKRTEDCYAVGGKDVDGVWLTAVRDHREGDPVTYKIAILAERRVEQ